MKPPAFQFYADDFLSGTADMTNEEVGAYIRLLCQQWTKGGLPKEPERLSMMAGAMPVPSLGYVLAKFQSCDDGLLRNARLERVRENQVDYRKKQAEKGRKGAKERWKNGSGHSPAIAQALPKQWPENGSPSPSPSPTLDSNTPNRSRAPAVPKPTDEAWLKTLQNDAAYAALDVGREFGRARLWCETKNRNLTRRFFLGWLNRIEKPMSCAGRTSEFSDKF